ncbi:amidohydrolase [Microbacterium sp. ABRD28]|uniref:M20 metallopeptidase family protein n=1 Tax=Microbacterium sp. ABRD28 TaxID=2268461 RepID=UPI001F0CCBFE|nr:amidohydrolase [Microbacterium sp. ABRD28]
MIPALRSAEATLFASVDEQVPAAITLRRQLHAEPRVAGDEGDTLAAMVAALPEGAEVDLIPGHAAIVTYPGDGPLIAFRAELDALPLSEDTGVAWASSNGAMHACGHDVHMAAVVAVVQALRAAEEPMPVTVLLQPREETYPSGALDVVHSEAFGARGIQSVIGAHVQPLLESGLISCTPGVVNAAADEFTVRFTGNEGHAAYPHLTADPVLTASQFVVAAQQIVSRNTDPMSPAVVTVGTIHAGQAANAVPHEAVLTGTLRAMHPSTRTLLHLRLREIADGVAAAHGCRAEVSIVEGEPELFNAPALTEVARSRLAGLGALSPREIRSCGADDFAYYSSTVPSIMMFVGVDAAGQGLHSRDFLPDDAAVGSTARALLAGYLAAREAKTLGAGGALREEVTSQVFHD